MAVEFEKQSGVRTNIVQKGSGETMAQIRAEAANPRGDIWWGGTGEPHLQAAELGLTESYRSPRLEELHPWARRQAEQSGFRTVGIYAGALGIAFNTEQLARKNLAAPKCWKDLIAPGLRDEVQMSNPASSGTAYFALTPEAQSLAARAKSYQTPSHMRAAVPAQAPNLADMKLIDYDFAKYGSSAERKRLIEKWEKEVGALPK